MTINNCPECAAEVFSAGLALWDDADDAVLVFECVEPDCGWAGIESEWRVAESRAGRRSASAAA